MAINFQKQAMFWLGAFALFFGFVWLFKGVLMPFALGFSIAYLLNPLVSWLEKIGLPRLLGTLFILSLFFVFVGVVLALALPPAYRESVALIENIPGYVDIIFNYLQPYLVWVQERLGDGYLENIKSFLRDNAGKIVSVTGGVMNGLASGGQALAGFMTTLVLTPLAAFFMMKEWPHLTNWIEGLYPRRNETVIRDLLKQIDQKLAGFVRGQLSVAFLLGLIYAVALSIAGLKYGFLIGLAAGVLSIIPMVGSTLGLVVGVVVAWFQMGEWSFVAIIASIFIVGQIVEGNILTPKLVGDSVGLHPLWIVFALMAGGSLFGILGMLLAVPVAAVIGVLVGFAILKYKKSPIYKKHKPKPAHKPKLKSKKPKKKKHG